MEKIKMLGVLTLYNIEKDLALNNMERYAPYLDQLVVWDNSADNHSDWFPVPNIEYHWTGENTYIASAINFARHYAEELGYDLLLIMDQDSRWEDFSAFRHQVEICYQEDPNRVFCPYIPRNDAFEIKSDIQVKNVFINSGTVIPIHILDAIGGADELFPLDALDYDLSRRIQDAGYSIVSLTHHRLIHTIGKVQRMGPLNIATNNYGPERTYSITKSHILYYRKYRHVLPSSEKWFILKEHFIKKLYRVLLAEPQKLSLLKQMLKGIYDGLVFKFPSHYAK